MNTKSEENERNYKKKKKKKRDGRIDPRKSWSYSKTKRWFLYFFSLLGEVGLSFLNNKKKKKKEKILKQIPLKLSNYPSSFFPLFLSPPTHFFITTTKNKTKKKKRQDKRSFHVGSFSIPLPFSFFPPSRLLPPFQNQTVHLKKNHQPPQKNRKSTEKILLFSSFAEGLRKNYTN